MNTDELLPYVKELLRRAIATTLKVPQSHFASSPQAQAAVSQCLTNVMAIGYNESLDAATDDLLGMRSALGANISRPELRREIEATSNTFPVEIAGFARMHEMNRRNVEAKEIWAFLRAEVPIGPEYDDEWLRAVDWNISRSGNIPSASPSTASDSPFAGEPEDEEAFIRRVSGMDQPKTQRNKRRN